MEPTKKREKLCKLVDINLPCNFKQKDEKSFTEAFREVTENPERTRRVMIESKEYGKQFHWKEVIKRILSDLEKVKC